MHDLVIGGGSVVDGSGGAPFTADVAIDGERVTAVGVIARPGRTEIAARGRIVAPGFVDIHTHYGRQTTSDGEMASSSWHGATTAIMRNCCVTVAPARPDRHAWLIGLMEDVEDIPGTALGDGMR